MTTIHEISQDNIIRTAVMPVHFEEGKVVKVEEQNEYLEDSILECEDTISNCDEINIEIKILKDIPIEDYQC